MFTITFMKCTFFLNRFKLYCLFLFFTENEIMKEKTINGEARQMILAGQSNRDSSINGLLQGGLPSGILQVSSPNGLAQGDFANGVLSQGSLPGGVMPQGPLPNSFVPQGTLPKALTMQGNPVMAYNSMLQKELNTAQIRHDLGGGNPSPSLLSQNSGLRQMSTNALLSQINQLSSALAAKNAGGNGPMTQGQAQGPAPGYYNTIMQNPLVGPNGMTKDVLSDLMFGSLKQLASPLDSGNVNSAFASDEQNSNGLLNGYSNSAPNGLFGSLGNGNNLGGNGVGMPIIPKDDLHVNARQESPRHHSRRHKTRKHKKKEKLDSNSAAKVLLTLLVDKLKDIYEIDKLNATLKTNKVEDSETAGKIASLTGQNSTVNRNNIYRNLTEKRVEGAAAAVAGQFATNLSFPLTVSGEKSTKITITDSKGEDKNSSSELDKSVANMLDKLKDDNDGSPLLPKPDAGLPNGTRGKILETRQSIGVKKSFTEVSPIVAKSETADPIDDGVSEFHAIKINPEAVSSEGQTTTPDRVVQLVQTTMVPLDSPEPKIDSNDVGTVALTVHAPEGVSILRHIADNAPEISSKESGKISPTVRVLPPKNKDELLNTESMHPSSLNNIAKVTSTVTSLPTSPLSAFLNKNEPANKKASNRIVGDSSSTRKPFKAAIAGFLMTPTEPASSSAVDIAVKDTDAQTKVDSITEKERTEYLKASRVLAAVYKKVKDPLAKKSVETAIKAMLKLIRNETPYSKRESVPSFLNGDPGKYFKADRNKLLNTISTGKKIKKSLQPHFRWLWKKYMKKFKNNSNINLSPRQNAGYRLPKQKHRKRYRAKNGLEGKV